MFCGFSMKIVGPGFQRRRRNLLIVEQPRNRDVPDAPLRGTRRLELPRIRLDRLHQVAERLVRRVRAHLHAGRIEVDQAKRREGGARQIGESLVVHHRDLDGDDADRVAVRRRRCDRLVPDHAAPAGAIDHVDRLPEIPLDRACEHARDRVGAPTGSPRHDQRDRTVRILRRPAARDAT